MAGPSRRTPRARAALGVRHDVVIRLAYLRLSSSPLVALDAYMSRVSPELLEQLRPRTHLTDLPGSRRQGRADEGASLVALARQPQLMLQLRQRLGVKQLPAAPQPAVGGEPRAFAGLHAANGPVREGHLEPGELGRRSTAHDSLPPVRDDRQDAQRVQQPGGAHVRLRRAFAELMDLVAVKAQAAHTRVS